MSITGSSSVRRLQDVAVVMDLDELGPVGGQSTGRRDWWWLKRFAKMGQDLTDRPWLRDERDQPDVAAAVAPGRVDFRSRPGPTQLAALCLGSM
jgi:hypothetical protein